MDQILFPIDSGGLQCLDPYRNVLPLHLQVYSAVMGAFLACYYTGNITIAVNILS